MSNEQRNERQTKGARDDARQFAITAAHIASDNKTEDVRVLDLRGLSNLTDYFVIGTGTSDRQMRAVLDDIRQHARESGRERFNVSDVRNASWLLADYVDVVVHLFDEKHREFYDLESLWGDAPGVEWRETGEATDESGAAPSAGSPT